MDDPPFRGYIEDYCQLFVGGLHPATNNESLHDFFEQFGAITKHIVVRDKLTRRSRGFGFVTFSLKTSLSSALASRPHAIGGHMVDTKLAIPRNITFTTPSPRELVVKVSSNDKDVTEDTIVDSLLRFGTITNITRLEHLPLRTHLVTFDDRIGAAEAVCKHTVVDRVGDDKSNITVSEQHVVASTDITVVERLNDNEAAIYQHLCQGTRTLGDKQSLTESPQSRPTVSAVSNQFQNRLLLDDDSPFIRTRNTFDCPICLTAILLRRGIHLKNCDHQFCIECFREFCRSSTDAELKCPFIENDGSKCGVILQPREIKAILSGDEFSKRLQLESSAAEHVIDGSFHCRAANCSGWWICEDNDPDDQRTNKYTCPVCHQVNCIKCKAIHGDSCETYQHERMMRGEFDENEQMLEALLRAGYAMKCVCGVIVEKDEGCDWVQCSKGQFLKSFAKNFGFYQLLTNNQNFSNLGFSKWSQCQTELCWATKGPRWGPAGNGDISGGCRCKVGQTLCHPNCRNCH